MGKVLARYLQNHESRWVRLLEELVGVATVNPPGENYAEMVDLLRQHCRRLEMETQVYRVPNERVQEVVGTDDFPRYNLIARWNTGAARTVHFNAHYDVVPAAGPWRFGDPFKVAVNRGRLYGRGAGDMKGSMAALLMAIEALQQTGARPAFNVECSFTPDEETGGELGAGYLVDEGLIEADYVVVCEGASGAQVGCGHNGVLWLEVEVQGKAAHASRPAEGINAFEKMVALVQGLKGYQKRLTGPQRRYCDFDGRQRSPTINLGGVFGGGPGDKINTVPSRACFSIDRRLVPGEDLSQVEAELCQTLESVSAAKKVQSQTRTLLRIRPCVVDPAHPFLRSFARILRSVRRCKTSFKVSAGFTDLHHFVEEGGLPGLGYGVKGERVHGRDEWVRVRDLVQTARTYAEFMRQEREES